MTTLLVPLDFSETTQPILQKAVDLAALFSARIIVLHVTEPVATYVPVGGSLDVISATPPPLQIEETSVQQERLARLVQPFATQGIGIESLAVIGLAADEIVEQAARNAVDYIVMGSHGHGALYHLFSGSVVTGVLKRAHCPVIVIPARKE